MSFDPPTKPPFSTFSLVALLLGLLLITLGALMVAAPVLFIQVAVVLLGIPVVLAGVGLVLLAAGLWREPPQWRRHVRIEKWRFWSGKDR